MLHCANSEPDPLTGRMEDCTEEMQTNRRSTLPAKQQPDLGVDRRRKQKGKL